MSDVPVNDAPAGRGRRSGLLGLVAVLVTAAGLVVAGLTPRDTSAATTSFERVTLDSRTFVCTGGLPKSEAEIGNAAEGRRSDAPIEAGSGPLVTEMDKAAAASAYASQRATAETWSAWAPCPEPRARWFFVGAGAGVGHDTVLTVHNPRTGAAVVDIDVFGNDGAVDAPRLHGITVDPGATATYDLADVAPAPGEVAVRVIARRGLVAVSAADSFSPGTVGKPVQEWLPAQTLPSMRTTLVGLPAKPAAATLIVANPGQTEAVAEIKVIGADGTFSPTEGSSLQVPPKSIAKLPLTAVFDGTPVAIRVESDRSLTATVRSVADDDIGFATGVRRLREVTTVAVPPGGGQLVLSSVRRAGRVSVTGYGAKGQPLTTREVEVAAQTTVAVPLGARVRAVAVDASGPPSVVAGLVHQAPHALTSAGISPAIREIRLPVVRQGW